jgi:hypothetical protein
MIRIIALILISLLALGFVLFLLFSKRQKPWNEMTEQEKNRKKLLVAGGTAVFIAGIISAVLLGKKK